MASNQDKYVRVVIDCVSDDDFDTEVVYLTPQQVAAQAHALPKSAVATKRAIKAPYGVQRKRRPAPIVVPSSEEDASSSEEESGVAPQPSSQGTSLTEPTLMPDPFAFQDETHIPEEVKAQRPRCKWEDFVLADLPPGAVEHPIDASFDLEREDMDSDEAEDTAVIKHLLEMSRRRRERGAASEASDEGSVTEEIVEDEAIPYTLQATGTAYTSASGVAHATGLAAPALQISVAPFFADTPRWVDQGEGRGAWLRPSQWGSGASPGIHTDSKRSDPGRVARASTISQRTGLRNTIQNAAAWPINVIHLADNYNPHGIVFQDIPAVASCGCYLPCRIGSCANAEDYRFCTPTTCAFGGVCGNGIGQVQSLRLKRNECTREYSVFAAEDIEENVTLGPYFGQLRHADARSTTSGASKKNGYVLLMHADLEHPRGTRICIDAKRMGTLMRFVNHSCAPVARFRQVCSGDRHVVVVVTTKAIRRGEEVTVDYGNALWFRCRCNKSECVHG